MTEKIDRFVRGETAGLLRCENETLFFEGYPETEAKIGIKYLCPVTDKDLETLQIFMELGLADARRHWNRVAQEYKTNKTWLFTVKLSRLLKLLGSKLSETDGQEAYDVVLCALYSSICGAFAKFKEAGTLCPVIHPCGIEPDGKHIVVELSSPYLNHILWQMLEEEEVQGHD